MSTSASTFPMSPTRFDKPSKDIAVVREPIAH